MNDWKVITTARNTAVDYSILKLEQSADGMACLRQLFPNSQADEMNFVLFSTSGIHGSYTTIEDYAESKDPAILEAGITFLVIHPRVVGMRYGAVKPKTSDDFNFLKRLRASSGLVAIGIGNR